MPSSSLSTLSVVVPNYNHAKYLETCLKGILQQSIQPLEVIVLDDASTDDSVEVIKRFAAQNPLVRLVENPKNLGAMPNVKKGVEFSRGECVFVAPADDEVVPGLFEKSLRLLAQYPQAALCCAMAEWRETFSGLVWYMAGGMGNKPCYLSPDDLVRLGKAGKLGIISSSCVSRREPLLNAGGYIPELRWHADWFATYVTAFRHGVCFVPEVLSLANLLPGSFYQSGSKTAQHRQVLLNLLECLHNEQYADVLPRVRESGALALFEMPLLRLLLPRREYRHLITPNFLLQVLRRKAELTGKRIFPFWLARWCVKRFYRAPQPDPGRSLG
jgi:glycosyltransferase involved in cell wall biosynthesis